jgi:hypothetical protein
MLFIKNLKLRIGFVLAVVRALPIALLIVGSFVFVLAVLCLIGSLVGDVIGFCLVNLLDLLLFGFNMLV